MPELSTLVSSAPSAPSAPPTPAATARRVPAYELLAADIQAQGVTTVFGLMSDDTALFVTTLDGMGVRFHGARHENNAIAMAEGYAAATGRLGIAIIGRGPATANALHGAVYAARTGSKVLLIFGYHAMAAAPPNGLGPDGKAFSALGVLEAAGLKTYVAADAHGARRTLAEATAAANAGGCVALLLPTNVQNALLDFSAPTAAPAPTATPLQRPRLRARPAAIAAASALLSQSRRPLFIAGLGAWRSGARDALIALADKVGAVLATTLKAKDMFRGEPDNLGILGSFSHAAARRLIDQADCIVAFGAGLNQRTTSYGTALPAGVPLIQVDLLRSNIGRWCAADIAVVADALSAAEQLSAALAERPAADKVFHTRENRDFLAGHDLASEFQPAPTPRTMDPRSLGIALDRLLPANRNAVYDAGNFLQVLPYISAASPDHHKNSHDFSSIGMGFGTALGFACGTPGRPTVLFLGDGSFLMTMGELETAVREDIPLIIILMNDCAYGAELHFLKTRDMPVAMSVFPDVDYAPVAAAFGFDAHTVRTLAELEALAPRLRNPAGPFFLDCTINAAVVAPFLLETVEHERRKT